VGKDINQNYSFWRLSWFKNDMHYKR